MALVHILHNLTDEIIGTLDSNLGEVMSPLLTTSIENQNMFDFTAFKKFDILADKNRVIVQDKRGNFHEFIIDYENQKGNKKYVKTDASFLEIKGKKIIEKQQFVGATPEYLIDFALPGTGWEKGNIEYPGIIRTLTIDDRMDPYDFLKLIATTFDMELSFRIEVSGIKVKRFVDLKVYRGEFDGKEAVFGKDLIDLERNVDSSNLATALLGVGPMKDDGTHLTVLVEDEEARQRWGREGKHILDIYTPESEDANMTLARLKTLTTTALKKRSTPVVSYKGTIASIDDAPGMEHEAVWTGQTLRIKDEHFNPPLFLGARVKETTEDVSIKKVLDFEIGNFKEYKKSELEKQVAALKAKITEKLSKLVTCSIITSGGTVFKNDDWDEVMVTAKVFLAGAEVDESGTIYNYRWTWKDKLGNAVARFDGHKSMMVESPEVDEKLSVMLEVMLNSKVLAADEVTFTKVYDGESGADGKTSYIHIAYANSSDGTANFSLTDPTNRAFIGQYTDFVQAGSTDHRKYTWSLIQGPKGDTGPKGDAGNQGVQGPKGADGTVYYTWIKYADNASGDGISTSPTGKSYIGIAYNKTTPTMSNIAADYTWSLFLGPQGVQGVKGADGQTTYTWIKYADDEFGNGLNDYPDGKRYLGLAYNKNTPNESTNKADYMWSPLYDNVVIGGPNIIRNSTRFLAGAAGTGITPSISPEGYLQIVSAAGNEGWHTGWLWDGTGIEEAFNEGDDVVISFDMRSTGHKLNPQFYFKAGMGYFPMKGSMSTSFSKIWVATKWKKANVFQFHFNWSGIVGTTIIKNIKLEKGNVPTAHTLAPEDTNNYTWTMYANDKNGSGITSNPAGKLWKGSAYNKQSPTPSLIASDYKWEFITENWMKLGTVLIDGGNIFVDFLSAITAHLGNVISGNMQGVSLKLGGLNGEFGQLIVLGPDGETVITLDGEQGGFDKLWVGDFFSPTVANFNDKNMNFYVDPNGDDNNDGLAAGTGRAKRTIQACIDLIPKFNNGIINIYLKAPALNTRQDYYENVIIDGFTGSGEININGRDWYNYLNSRISIKGCTNKVNINDLTINVTSNGDALEVYNSSHVSCVSVWVYGQNKAGTGFLSDAGSKLTLVKCEAYDVLYAVYANSLSTAYLYQCKGLGTQRGLLAERGSWIYSYISHPNGTVGDRLSRYASGTTLDGSTADAGAKTGGGKPAPPAQTTTQWISNNSDNWSSIYNSWQGGGARQGDYGYGQRKGLWWFESQPFAATLNGKSIKSMRIWVKRASSGGSSGKTRIYFHPHTFATKSATPNNPSLSLETTYNVYVDLAWGEGAWVNIPSSWFAGFQSGSYKGVGIWAGSTSRAYYSIMDGNCWLEATY